MCKRLAILKSLFYYSEYQHKISGLVHGISAFTSIAATKQNVRNQVYHSRVTAHVCGNFEPLKAAIFIENTRILAL